MIWSANNTHGGLKGTIIRGFLLKKNTYKKITIIQCSNKMAVPQGNVIRRNEEEKKRNAGKER
jgi:hypothetical protein